MAKLVVANWKSNKTKAEVSSWLKQFLAALSPVSVEVVLAPPFVFIDFISRLMVSFSYLKLAVQDLSPYPAGSYTGAISAVNLKGLQVEYAIVGHSERRRWFHETNNDVALKVEQALANQLKPIVCVDDDTMVGLAGKLAENVWRNCIIAYEPSGAIGTGMGQDVGLVEQAVKKIHGYFGRVKVLYGGSVDERNINEYLLVSDGVLVGNDSLAVNQFLQLLKAIK